VEYFNTTKGDLRDFLKSELWTIVMQPTIVEQTNSSFKALMSLPTTRPNYSDDFLRGRISGLMFASENWQQVLDERDANRPQETDDPLVSPTES
jgi:hypothetical protein